MATKYDTSHSPFLELRAPFTAYEALKLVLLAPLVLPRLLIVVLAVAIVAAINSVAAYNWPVDKPLTPWRRRLVLFSKELLVVVFVMLGFRIRVRGREHIKTAEQLGAVSIFNHVAWLDAFIVVWLMAPSGVAKAFNAQLPVIKHAVRALQTVYIPDNKPRRTAGGPGSDSSSAGGGGDGAQDSQKRVNAFIVSSSVTEVLKKRVEDPRYCQLGGYPMVVMAPEGTCGDGRCLLEFRTGAFVLQRPILPICLHYKWKHHNPAWTIVTEAWHFLRILCQFQNTLDVTILPPYVPSKAELEDPKLYAGNVRALMSEALGGMPLSQQSHDDYVMLKKLKVTTSWDGRKVVAPPGIVDSDGMIDVEKHWAKKAS